AGAPEHAMFDVKAVGASPALAATGARVYLLGRRRALAAAVAVAASFWTASAFAGGRIAKASAERPATLRVDYYHSGNATEERFSLDRVVLEPLPWPGNPDRPIDDTNRGKYFFEVLDDESRKAS